MKKLLFAILLALTVSWTVADGLFGFTDRPSETVLLPDVVGRREDAIDLPDTVELLVEYRYDAEHPAGEILAQEPPGGSRRKLADGKRYPLRLVVSLGAEEKTVPELAGSDAASAAAELRREGFAVEEVPISGENAGRVIKTEPPAGSLCPSGSRVRLFVGVASPAESVAVPDLIGLDRETALLRLYLAGLRADTVTEETSDSAPPNTVIRQSPAPGSLLPLGGSVRIVVGGG